MLEQILNSLQNVRFPLHNEKETQASIANRLSDCNINFEREYRLDFSNIVDFFIDGIVIEVKIKCNRRVIYGQCKRYSAFDNVKAIILITSSSMGFPSEINEKPSYLINLGKAWL